MSPLTVILLVFHFALLSECQKSHNFRKNRHTIVQLFEWKWTDIAVECERFLQHKGYGGVQISPANENLIVENRPWWERYQPVSYKIITRSGDEADFLNMTKRCNAVGIRIYVDTVINHMAAKSGNGTGGSISDVEQINFPAIPYDADDFHKKCTVDDYQSADNVRYCRLAGLLDLDHSKKHVQEKILEYMNHLIDLGVAGFRIDAAKHMYPSDLAIIYAQLKNLNTEFGFETQARPFIYQEVIDSGNEAVRSQDYTSIGAVIEFKYSNSLSRVFSGGDKLKWLINFGPEWNLLDGLDAVAFIDNHDNQRGSSLSYKQPKEYKMAVAFMLAHPYGTTRIMSSYHFDNFNQGPPADASGDILSPEIDDRDGTCRGGWVCEHRWREIHNMVGFRNVVTGFAIQNWWSSPNGDQIAFGRGARGFIVFTKWGDVDAELQTGLPAGIYCDIISGQLANGNCTGKLITVRNDGIAHFQLGALEFNGIIAIHVESKM